MHKGWEKTKTFDTGIERLIPASNIQYRYQTFDAAFERSMLYRTFDTGIERSKNFNKLLAYCTCFQHVTASAVS